MTNQYYTPSTLTPRTVARAGEVNDQLNAIQAGFDKLPTPTQLKEARVDWAGTDTGSANVYVVSLPYPPSAYSAGMKVRFIPANTNTGASTVNVDGLGAKAIKRSNGDDLIEGDITAGTIATIEYDGSDFRLTSTNQADVLLASLWATKTSGPVSGGEFSAKYHAQAAASSASAAATSESNAATSENNAATSETNAASSASGAAASLDSFEDIYLGAAASDPTQTANGTALAAGMVYFYTGAPKKWRVYDGSAWQDVEASTVSAYIRGLLDDPDAATARGTLGLGSAALQVDTRYNHRSNNLSDVASASTARGNLGLGTAAVEDIDALPATILANTVALSGDISPSQITADQNDYSPTGLSGASTLRLSTDASRTITGLAGGSDGRVLVVHNVGSNELVLADESGSSTAANRFALGEDVTLQAGHSIVLWYDTTSGRWRAAALFVGSGGVFEGALLHVQHQETSGTDAGGSSSGDNDRPINTIVTDEIGITGVTSPKIEGLPAGDYYIEASAGAYKADQHKLRLYDVTAAANLLHGTSEYVKNANAASNRSFVYGRFTLSQVSDLKLIHYFNTGTAGNGLGLNAGSGDTEIYTDIRIWKVG